MKFGICDCLCHRSVKTLNLNISDYSLPCTHRYRCTNIQEIGTACARISYVCGWYCIFTKILAVKFVLKVKSANNQPDKTSNERPKQLVVFHQQNLFTYLHVINSIVDKKT